MPTMTDAALQTGRVGLWTAVLDTLPPPAVRDQLAALEQQGWASLWFGEAYGREAFTNAQLMLGATSRMAIGTGIANVWARDPMAAAGAARLLEAAHPGRFVLGLGISHQPLVERMRGHAYASPLATMREYVEKLAGATHAAAGAHPGAPAELPPVVLAALGPRMLELARDRTAGAHPYLVTPEHTASAREVLGPGKALVVEQAVVLSGDPEVVRARAHWHLEIYTGLPNYRNNWLRLGFSSDDLVRGGSDRLKSAMVVGGEAAAVERVRAHLDAGADQVLVQVLGDSVGDVPALDWERLAPALVGL